MPLYDFQCSAGHIFERMVPLVDFEVAQLCACTAPATRRIAKPMFRVEAVGYSCPITGKHIGSKHEHEENLRIHDCRVLETGEKELNERRRVEADESFERTLDESVESDFWALPSEKREKLANELESGLDIAVERK